MEQDGQNAIKKFKKPLSPNFDLSVFFTQYGRILVTHTDFCDKFCTGILVYAVAETLKINCIQLYILLLKLQINLYTFCISSSN